MAMADYNATGKTVAWTVVPTADVTSISMTAADVPVVRTWDYSNDIINASGLTVKLSGVKSAMDGETVTVTVTVKGLVETGGVTLKTNNGNWNGTASDTMTIAANTNYVTATQLVYSFVISADATPTITLS